MAVMLISLTIEDADGDKSSVTVYAEQDALNTIGGLGTDYVSVLWDVIRPLISGVLVKASVTVDVDISAFTNNAPSAISDVEEKATFHIRVCGTQRPLILSLPTVKESIFENSGTGKYVDFTNGDVGAFAYVMYSDLVDGGIDATDRHGNDLCEVLFGQQTFRRG